MDLTKEVLKKDRADYVDLIRAYQAVISYIDGQLAFLDKQPEAPVAVAESQEGGDADTQ